MKIVYMGTPDFAVEPLEELIRAGHEITMVITQPDREKGRGKAVVMSPVKECALRHGIPVFQPVKIREEESVRKLSEVPADLFVVAAFGQILPESILKMPRFGCVNIHASLLPKYRGAAPIQWAILNGDQETGITIMQMGIGLDDGDILLQKKIAIGQGETGDGLFEKLKFLGAKALLEAIPLIESGSITPVKQDEEKATHVKKITKEMGKIDWTLPADRIERSVRALNSWPSAYTSVNGKSLKIWNSSVVNMTDVSQNDMEPGTVISVKKDSFTVLTGTDALMIHEVQLEGKKRMNVHDFLLGFSLTEGMILGS